MALRKGLPDDFVLRHEARERRNAGDRERRDQESHEGDRHLVPQPAHLAHVLLAAHRMDDRARAEEEAGLEERMRHQVEDARGIGADADRREHVAELADGRVRENLLDVVLRDADGRGEERRQHPIVATNSIVSGRHREEEVQARDHVDARSDHRRRVDQRADRSRTRHRIGEPYVERNLRRFAGRAEEEKQRDEGRNRHPEVGHVAREQRRILRDFTRDQGRMPDGIEAQNKVYSPMTKAQSPTRLTMKALLPAVVLERTLYQKPISAKEHSPTPSHPTNISNRLSPSTRMSIAKVNRLSHREEAPERLVVVHVAGRVDVDEAADAGDDQRHDHRKRVEPPCDIDVDAADREPRPHAVEHEAAFVRQCEDADEAPSPRGGRRR